MTAGARRAGSHADPRASGSWRPDSACGCCRRGSEARSQLRAGRGGLRGRKVRAVGICVCGSTPRPAAYRCSIRSGRSLPSSGGGNVPHCHSWRTAKQHPAWTKRPHRGNSPAGATRPCRAHRIPFSATGPMTIGLAALLLLEQVVFDEQRPVFIAAAGEQFGRTLLPIDDGRH